MLSTQSAVTYTVEMWNVVLIGQDPTTEMTHRLNQFPVFSSVISLCLSKSSVLALFHKTEQCMCYHVIYEHSKKVL